MIFNLNVFVSTQVTQLFRSKWINFSSQCTKRKKLSHIDFKNWVTGHQNSTQLFRSKWLNFFSLSAPREKIESFWLKKLSHYGIKIRHNILGQNDSLFLSVHREKKWSHYDLKSWVTDGIIIQPGKVSNWRIIESIWLSMLSQFDSQWWVNLTFNIKSIWLPCRANLTPMLSQFDSHVEPIWLPCWANLTLIVEPIIWLSMLSQLDSQCWVRLSMLTQFNS